jgi:phytoene synthase
MFELFVSTSESCSKLITQAYSTSFSLGIRTLDRSIRNPIYNIYAFVRYADEIVDTFHDFDKSALLAQFKQQTYQSIYEKISLNPVLFSFQKTVNEYQIDLNLVEAFFKSMETDLSETTYDRIDYVEYIYGSAEVVGLMCLKVFTHQQPELYDQLKAPARSLGAAFQKVNFLRDMKSDFEERGRVYFPGIDFTHFQEEAKAQIEKEILLDFQEAEKGIRQLPDTSRRGVRLAYRYYLKLFQKIQSAPAHSLKETRIRVPDTQKLIILAREILSAKVGIA